MPDHLPDPNNDANQLDWLKICATLGKRGLFAFFMYHGYTVLDSTSRLPETAPQLLRTAGYIYGSTAIGVGTVSLLLTFKPDMPHIDHPWNDHS